MSDTAAGTSAGARRSATYTEIFANGEYRAVFGSAALSWIGDYFARVAVSYLVYTQTNSVLLSGAAFAISYLPWVVGGPVLSALADRYPYRRVMIACDVVRMGLIATLALPGLPIAVLLALLFAAAMFAPPFESARSALLATILSGDRYVLGLSVQRTAAQLAQVIGYAAGGVTAAVDIRLALLIDAATFATSALLLVIGVRPRPAAQASKASLLADTVDGFRVVFTHPVLRTIALLVFAVVMFPIAIEGLAASWAVHLGGGSVTQGVLMAAVAAGSALGAVVAGRLVGPDTRLRLARPLAFLAAAALLPALLDPGVVVVVAVAMAAGFATMSVLLPLNGLFVSVLPAAYRARAFGIMQGGIQILEGLSVLTVSFIGGLVPVPIAVGAWGVLGLAIITAILTTAGHHLAAPPEN